MDNINHFQGERRAVRCFERRGGPVDAEMRGVVQRFAGEEGCRDGEPVLLGSRFEHRGGGGWAAAGRVALGFAASFVARYATDAAAAAQKLALGAFLVSMTLARKYNHDLPL